MSQNHPHRVNLRNIVRTVEAAAVDVGKLVEDAVAKVKDDGRLSIEDLLSLRGDVSAVLHDVDKQINQHIAGAATT